MAALLEVPVDCLGHLRTAVYLVDELARSNTASVLGRTSLPACVRPMLVWLAWETDPRVRGRLVEAISFLWDELRSDCVDEAQDEFADRSDMWCASLVVVFRDSGWECPSSRAALEDLQLLSTRMRPVFGPDDTVVRTAPAPGSLIGHQAPHDRRRRPRGRRTTIPPRKQYTPPGRRYTWDEHGNIVWIDNPQAARR